MYEIATIGDVRRVAPASARASAPVVIGALPDLQPFVTRPALIAAGAGLVIGLVVGALFFGGRRRG